MAKIIYYLKISILLFAGVFCRCSDYSKKLGSGYTFIHEGGNNNYIFHEYPTKGGEIPPNVISFDYDKHFIVVKQRPMPFQFGYETAEEYADRTDTIGFCYWLIIKEEHKVFGPFDSIGFQKYKKEYQVPENLILE